MPSPAVLDIPALLAPISAEKPAGEDLTFAVRDSFDELRKEIENPQRPEDAKKADWRGVVRLAQETLTKSSKHLRPAARLTEALVKLHGFAGLRDGFQLLRRLVAECWDRLNPPLDAEEVLELRTADFIWLDDPIRGPRLPTSLDMVPIFGPKPQYSFLDYAELQKPDKKAGWADFEKAVQTTPPQYGRSVLEDLGAALNELKQLIRVLDGKLGKEAPSLSNLLQTLERDHQVLKDIANKYWPVPVASPAAPPPNGQEAAKTAPTPAKALATRADAYRQLSEAAALLKQLEPHSPIPYLIQRAIDLGAMPFPQLIKELVREANVLTELSRVLGIKEVAPEQKK